MSQTKYKSEKNQLFDLFSLSSLIETYNVEFSFII